MQIMRTCNQLTVPSQVQYIGYFDTEEDAAVAYDREIVQQRGPSAQTNFPPVSLPCHNP